MQANAITAAIEPDIARALSVVTSVAQKQAVARAESIAQLSGGAVVTSPDQVAAIAAGIQDGLVNEIREQVRSTLNAYTATTELFRG
ncbi:hypothetical protein [Stenotrophomonas maltophilia]|uniref:hypothetical protein n=1 Tax=Stenotrophomonas maltophilia TaxID=40324 RepID=UPI002B1CFB3B|nr:hypothetical protein [Stenotrophomonas maltophilia]